MLHVARGRTVPLALPPLLTNCEHQLVLRVARQALISVTNRFLADVEMESDEIRSQVANHMAFAHESVGTVAEIYRASERREVRRPSPSSS